MGLNNTITHLEWSTGKENIQHAFATGLCNSDHCRVSVKTTEIGSGKVHAFKSMREAERKLNIGSGFVSAVNKGKYQTAKGYKFEFLNQRNHVNNNKKSNGAAVSKLLEQV